MLYFPFTECFSLLTFDNAIELRDDLIKLIMPAIVLTLFGVAIYYLMQSRFHKKEISEKEQSLLKREDDIEKLKQEINIRTENLENALQKAEESNRLKSLFLANMSHEIRTPLNAIMGFSELITEEEQEPNSKKLFAKQIRQNSQNLLNLIDQIFHLSIIETGKVTIRKEEFRINEILNTTLADTQAKIVETKKNIRLITNLENPDYRINTDREKLKLILENLFDNALKFTTHGIIEFTCLRLENEFLFRISDSGCGIREDECELIFDPFIQGSETIRKIKGGSGLGLTNVKNYVILLGGKIWCDLNRPNGTIFNFTIPASTVNKEELEILINWSIRQN